VEQAFKDEFRRRELADFLTSKRKRLKPRTSRPHGRRRLTSGLRREEVAERAGLGTSWYTWLEQARDIHASEVTLHRIARALQLTKAEERYFLDLALERAPRTIRDDAATPLLLSTVNGLCAPAMVIGQWWDVIAYNAAANALLDLDYAPTPNNRLRNMFTAQARALYPHWASFARELVTQFRARNGAMLAHPAVVTLVSELRQRSEHFRAFWAEQEVSSEMNSGHFIYDNPFVGRLTFEFEHLQVLESPSLTLLTQVCDGAETRRRFDELLRQQQNGEHNAARNLWTALAPRRHARTG
jgi:transcriptional regulator with XRE-family HTH domain